MLRLGREKETALLYFDRKQSKSQRSKIIAEVRTCKTQPSQELPSTDLNFLFLFLINCSSSLCLVTVMEEKNHWRKR